MRRPFAGPCLSRDYRHPAVQLARSAPAMPRPAGNPGPGPDLPPRDTPVRPAVTTLRPAGAFRPPVAGAVTVAAPDAGPPCAARRSRGYLLRALRATRYACVHAVTGCSTSGLPVGRLASPHCCAGSCVPRSADYVPQNSEDGNLRPGGPLHCASLPILTVLSGQLPSPGHVIIWLAVFRRPALAHVGLAGAGRGRRRRLPAYRSSWRAARSIGEPQFHAALMLRSSARLIRRAE